jgi:hypothetical protein
LQKNNDAFAQSWPLDGLGNGSSFNNDGATQTRGTNAANFILYCGYRYDPETAKQFNFIRFSHLLSASG